ncbi:hypothetical protein [Paenibacillus sp. IHBB 10380]|uniref:hypothetical protein n=1 Tax=Paenibacillus sp. IHBB 10380 TaxID=1566358 RepID=UPI001F415701|nr:hypothetical protein [Paenibacillus sp. IHBB 10380]
MTPSSNVDVQLTIFKAPKIHAVVDISDGTRFYYLSAIQDLFNNEIVAWQISSYRNGLISVQEKETYIGSRTPFGSGLPIYVSSVQQTIRSIQRQRQPLSQSNLPG